MLKICFGFGILLQTTKRTIECVEHSAFAQREWAGILKCIPLLKAFGVDSHFNGFSIIKLIFLCTPC